MGFGWAQALGFLADRFPSREEAIRNKIGKLEKERDELLKQRTTPGNVTRIQHIISELSVLEAKLKNR